MARIKGPRKIRRYSAEFKLKAVKLSQIEGVQVQDVADALDIHPFMFSRWRKEAREHAGFNLLLVLFVLGVVANVLYCLAYVADVFVQLSAVRHAWSRWRWVLFVIGTATAAVMTRFFALNAFSNWRGH